MSESQINRMVAILAKQRAVFTAALPEPLSVRQDRLDRAIALLVEHGEALAAAASADFGHRSTCQTMLTDIAPSVGALKHARRHCRAWSRDERRQTMFPLGLIGGRARVIYQPKGVVGIIAPWNFPVGMVMSPLAGVFAAGNRAMIKPSEFTPRVSHLLAELMQRRFDEEELAVFTGDLDVARGFSGLPFDHLIFTGATGVGRQILRAAAENLVPVTLELGGKSPVIIGRSANLRQMGERIALGKMMNAGQICLAPDYLLVPKELEEKVISEISRGVCVLYPSLLANDDYTSVVNQRNYDRLTHYLNDAREKGGEVIVVNPADEDFVTTPCHKMPLTIIRKADPAMRVMQEEIFGPILPIITYDQIEQAIAFVNHHDRPLGLYYFGRDAGEENQVLSGTISGGVTVNDVVFHTAMEDLPFGGIGPSGMGAYHGFDGFRTFSHAKAVFRQSPFDVAALSGLRPPYGKAARRFLAMQLGKSIK